MKKALVLAMALLMLAGLGACKGNPVGDIVDSAISRLSGDVAGEVGQEYQTQWFNFKINSLETVDTYRDETAPEGYVYLVANVYEKNTSDVDPAEAIPMSCYDFYALEGDATEEVDAEEPWNDAMMPSDFYLDPDEECTYDVVFVVSKDVSDVKFVYVEVADDSSTHATFTISHTL